MLAAKLRPLVILLVVVLGPLTATPCLAGATDTPARVYVVLWLDTEDYILPASDEAALRIANMLTREEVRATFKVVGEKARTLERRGRADVIEALKKHEIGYHSNFHSVQPSPAMYLANLGWAEGVEEFDRRERPGFDDVRRIFGRSPTCYGQPGSSWAPQSYGAMRRWKMGIYLDSGSHVSMDGRPCYYCGILNLYHLTHTIRANLNNPELKEAEDRFLQARKQLLEEGGGVVSICYHPCEFVHRHFWDGVNFRNGANPPREQWKLPPTKTPEESAAAFRVLESYVRFQKRFPDVRFVTATEAARLYEDRAQGRRFTPAEIHTIAANAVKAIDFQVAPCKEYALAPSEILTLLLDYVASRADGGQPEFVELRATPDGPADPPAPMPEVVVTDRSQFLRTLSDVRDYLRVHGRVPSNVWLGSRAVPPESYLSALASAAVELVAGKPLPQRIELRPVKLLTASRVADDGPNLWRWVIFPPGFHAPALMELAKRQAWTLKPAILHDAENRAAR